MDKELGLAHDAFDTILKQEANKDLFTKVNTPTSDTSSLKPRITFLGTQSMKPGILRNVSAIHLEVSVNE